MPPAATAASAATGSGVVSSSNGGGGGDAPPVCGACGTCGAPLRFVLQVYAPVDTPSGGAFHRRVRLDGYRWVLYPIVGAGN